VQRILMYVHALAISLLLFFLRLRRPPVYPEGGA
jgi:hypothetical protein